MLRYGVLNVAERHRAKEESRQRDAEALAAGLVSPAELAKANGFFSSLDMSGCYIAARGRKQSQQRRLQHA
jgi:hypothetical protein